MHIVSECSCRNCHLNCPPANGHRPTVIVLPVNRQLSTVNSLRGMWFFQVDPFHDLFLFLVPALLRMLNLVYHIFFLQHSPQLDECRDRKNAADHPVQLFLMGIQTIYQEFTSENKQAHARESSYPNTCDIRIVVIVFWQ